MTVDFEKQEVCFGNRMITATIPGGPRNQLVGDVGLDGRAPGADAAIEETVKKLP